MDLKYEEKDCPNKSCYALGIIYGEETIYKHHLLESEKRAKEVLGKLGSFVIGWPIETDNGDRFANECKEAERLCKKIIRRLKKGKSIEESLKGVPKSIEESLKGVPEKL